MTFFIKSLIEQALSKPDNPVVNCVGFCK